jgi:hypothetical protein
VEVGVEYQEETDAVRRKLRMAKEQWRHQIHIFSNCVKRGLLRLGAYAQVSAITRKGGFEAIAQVVGPMLGFRGSENGMWHICALSVTTEDTTLRKLTWFVENKDQGGKDHATSN